MSQHVPPLLPTIQLNLNNDRYDRHEQDLTSGTNDPNATGSAATVPSLWGMPLKYVSLVTLAVQNSMLTVIMHYSRVSTRPSRAYSAATAVLLNELLKGFISLLIAFSHVGPPGGLSLTHTPDISQAHHFSGAGSLWNPRVFLFRCRKLGKEIFSPDCWKLSIPAILYVIQNNLQFVAVSNLEAATFQVSYQMKILTTAAFSVLLLRKKLLPSQWLALLFLAIGVGIVQIQTGVAKIIPTVIPSLADLHTMNPTKGFLAVAAACFTSGLAGVYFEMVLKNSQGDLWVRNVQLSLFSLLPALVPILFSHTSGSTSGGATLFQSLFHDFGGWAWATVAVQVLGGLVTAMVIKYSDNILKGFATSLSIVISFLASVALFDFQLTLTFILGSLVVLIATWLYNQQPKRAGLSIGKDALGWSLGWSEKWRGPTLSTRSPSGGPEFTISRISSSASTLSLSVISSSTHYSTPALSEDESYIKEKKNTSIFGR